MEPNIFDKIHDIDLKDNGKTSYRLCDERY